MPDDGVKDKTPGYDQIYGASSVKFSGGGAAKRRRTISGTTHSGVDDLYLPGDYIQGLCSLKGYTFVEAIVEDALVGGPCTTFVLWFLGLPRRDKRCQKAWTNLVEEWSRRDGRDGSRWVTSLAQSLWTCFTSMKRWSSGILGKSSCATTMVDRRLEDLSRSKATVVAGTGLVLPRKEYIAQVAMEFARTIVDLATKHCTVLWIDNCNTWRYRRNVCRKSDMSINATCVAVLPVPHPDGGFPPLRGVLCIPDLLRAAQPLPQKLREAGRLFQSRIDTLRGHHLNYDSVRTTLDIRRYGVTMAPWCTADVLPCNVSAWNGLLQVCSNLIEWRQRTNHQYSPVLCDVDVYFRIHKLHHNTTYVGVHSE